MRKWCLPVVVGLTACAGPTSTTTLPEVNTAIVTWIVDGDTLEVDLGGQPVAVRLLGVNSPDRGECFYDEATDHLIEVIKGETVRIDPAGTDQFDRLLAWVWLGETLVNQDLVETGLAIATTGDQGDAGQLDFFAEEETAFEAGLGLWADDACGGSADVTVSIVAIAEDPSGPDDERLAEETVTIRNTGPDAVDLSGWTLRDESSRHRCHLDRMIGPGEEIPLSSDDSCWDPGGQAVWNNIGDMAILYDRSGNVAARFRYQLGG